VANNNVASKTHADALRALKEQANSEGRTRFRQVVDIWTVHMYTSNGSKRFDVSKLCSFDRQSRDWQRILGDQSGERCKDTEAFNDLIGRPGADLKIAGATSF
jgi:hypothetical protein